MSSEHPTRRKHLELVPAGETALHSINENGICKYCGRLWEEIQAGYFKCCGFQKGITQFQNDEYVKAPRHPLFLDAIFEIRNCTNCMKRHQGFCKKHEALKQFLWSK